MAEPLACPRCALRYPLEERFCSRVRHAAHVRGRGGRRAGDHREAGARPQDQAAVRARRPAPRGDGPPAARGGVHPDAAARGGRPQHPAPLGRASTCPTCWPPARATCSCPSPGSRPRATCCCRATSRSRRRRTSRVTRPAPRRDGAGLAAARGRHRRAADLAQRRVTPRGLATPATPGVGPRRAPSPLHEVAAQARRRRHVRALVVQLVLRPQRDLGDAHRGEALLDQARLAQLARVAAVRA